MKSVSRFFVVVGAVLFLPFGIGGAGAADFAQVVEAYNTAVRLKGDRVDAAFELVEAYLRDHPDDGLAITYKGSLLAQKARNSFWPWRKLGYVNEGIDLMDVGIDKTTRGGTVTGTPEELRALMVRGTSSARIPSMFKRGNVARADMNRVVQHPKFSTMSDANRASALSWSAVLAVRAGSAEEAEGYLRRARAIEPAVADSIWSEK